MSTKLNPKNGLFRICVDQKEDGRLSGRIVSQRLTAPMAFADLGDLLLKVEGVLDAQNFPQASQRIRTFVQDASEYPASVLPGGAMCEAEVEASRGALTTFQLAILTRRNATWQGAVDWMEGQSSMSFSSWGSIRDSSHFGKSLRCTDSGAPGITPATRFWYMVSVMKGM